VPLALKAISAYWMGSTRPSAMIVLSAITVGITSAVRTSREKQAQDHKENGYFSFHDLYLHDIFDLVE